MNSLLLMLARHSSTENISLYALVEYNKAERHFWLEDWDNTQALPGCLVDWGG